jgi:hypothetical protein
MPIPFKFHGCFSITSWIRSLLLRSSNILSEKFG